MEIEIIELISNFFGLGTNTFSGFQFSKEDFKGKTLPEIRYKLEYIFQKYHNCHAYSSVYTYCRTCSRYNSLCKYLDSYSDQMHNFDDYKFFDLTKKYNQLNSEHQKLVEKYNKMRVLVLMDQ